MKEIAFAICAVGFEAIATWRGEIGAGALSELWFSSWGTAFMIMLLWREA